MKVNFKFSPNELKIAEKLVKRLCEWHPGFTCKLVTNSNVPNSTSKFYHYYLDDKHGKPN